MAAFDQQDSLAQRGVRKLFQVLSKLPTRRCQGLQQRADQSAASQRAEISLIVHFESRFGQAAGSALDLAVTPIEKGEKDIFVAGKCFRQSVSEPIHLVEAAEDLDIVVQLGTVKEQRVECPVRMSFPQPSRDIE